MADERFVFVVDARVRAGLEDEFLRRYAALGERVAQGLDGHVSHRLCRALDEPGRWLIVSEWETLEQSQAWDRAPEHRQLTGALRECWDDVRRAGFVVHAETRHPARV
ncbi:MAG: antibiotic biosynthesis monooxygenase [Thermoleophilia bacterium]|nr:antibiotic biosynthesis monooxygenase [Thermoleophilia bacterium]